VREWVLLDRSGRDERLLDLREDVEVAVRQRDRRGSQGREERRAKVTLADAEPLPQAVAVAGGHVYWANVGGPTSNPWGAGEVRWEPTGGGAPATFSPATTPYPFAFVGLAADDTSLYWGGDNGALLREPLGGGTMTNLGAAGIGALDVAVDADNIYWTGDYATLTPP
jgi:hypothetical protein